jgi:triphosphoribosyl-dephospho-CoA synthase
MAILEAVREWRSFGLSGNTHFGEVTLLVPLVTAAGRGGVLEEELNSVLDASTTEDAISFYQAFQLSGARVAEVKDFSLKDPSASTRLQLQEKTLLELMRLSQGHDLIAKEWSTGFKRIFELSRMLSQKVEEGGWNDGVSLTFLEALSSEPDTLVQAKFDRFKAEEVSLRAAKVLQDKYPLNQAKKLDEALLEEGINPGSTADMIGAAIFIALMKGLRL